jgi:hypothetical protein
MTGPKTQTDKDKGSKPTDNECLPSGIERDDARALTKAFENHTLMLIRLSRVLYIYLSLF